MMIRSAALAAMLFLFTGCMSYQYEGESAGKETTHVKVYTDSAKIGAPYQVLGRATVSGDYQDVSRERMVEKLVSEAKSCGADAILIVEQQVVPGKYQSQAKPLFQTTYDYDTTNRSWSQLYRDVDLTYGNVRNRKTTETTVTNYRRILRAEFLHFTDPTQDPQQDRKTEPEEKPAQK